MKAIQAQISILEKNSNEGAAQNLLQEIQNKMTLLIKSTSFSAPKLKEEEALSHEEPAQPLSPKKLFYSHADIKPLRKDSAFSAFKTTDTASNSTIVPLGRLLNHTVTAVAPTNISTSVTCVATSGSNYQVGSINRNKVEVATAAASEIVSDSQQALLIK